MTNHFYILKERESDFYFPFLFPCVLRLRLDKKCKKNLPFVVQPVCTRLAMITHEYFDQFALGTKVHIWSPSCLRLWRK